MKRRAVTVPVLAAAIACHLSLVPASAGGLANAPVPSLCAGALVPGVGAAYYEIELVNTGRVAGARNARGAATVTFASSPFGLAVSAEGQYLQQIDLHLRDLSSSSAAVYAVWVTTPELDQIQLLGVLDEDQRVSGQVSWNKYLVVVTREGSVGEIGARWSGPIALRGMSRSGRMHTMAGHGPFQAEPCAKYGY